MEVEAGARTQCHAPTSAAAQRVCICTGVAACAAPGQKRRVCEGGAGASCTSTWSWGSRSTQRSRSTSWRRVPDWSLVKQIQFDTPVSQYLQDHVMLHSGGEVKAMEAEKVVQANIAKLLRLTDNSKAELPKDVEVKKEDVRVGIVPDSDPRVGLRGGRALYAARDLPAGYVVGVYRSAVHYLARHNLLVRHQPHESVWAASKTPAEWELWVESYCFSDPDGSYRSPCLQGEEAQLFADAVGWGNETALVNDPTVFPASLFSDAENDEDIKWCQQYQEWDKVAPPNCSLVAVSIRGWPFVFMIVLQPVCKGSELLYEYGAAYWCEFWRLCMAVHKERRREAFLKESFAEQWQRQQAERARPAWQQRQQPHVAVQQGPGQNPAPGGERPHVRQEGHHGLGKACETAPATKRRPVSQAKAKVEVQRRLGAKRPRAAAEEGDSDIEVFSEKRARRVSGAGAKEREEPRTLKDAYVRLAVDLGSGKPLHKVLSALILEQLYEPIKEALQERRAELEAEGRKLEEQRKAVEREKADAVVPYAESLEMYEDALERQRALLKKTVKDVQTQVARAEAAEAQLRKLSAGGSGARGVVEGEVERLRDQVNSLQAENLVLRESAARGGAGTTPEDASKEVSLMQGIDRSWIMRADMEQARAAALRLLDDLQQALASSVSKAGSMNLLREEVDQAKARAAKAEARAAKAEARAAKAEARAAKAEARVAKAEAEAEALKASMGAGRKAGKRVEEEAEGGEKEVEGEEQAQGHQAQGGNPSH